MSKAERPQRERGNPERVDEAIRELRSVLQGANDLALALEARLRSQAAAFGEVSTSPAAARARDLESRLEEAEGDQVQLTRQLVEAERQAGRLMGLYVATYQLHVSLDPLEVQNAIAEIARDLLGAEVFVLLIRDELEGGYEIALSQGLDDETHPLFTGDRYTGGDPFVDQTLADGRIRLEAEPGPSALAAVPLRVEEEIVGALVILRLLSHKVTPLAEDRDILDLLAAHAASALVAARVYSKTDRKLKTLEGLVGLIRGT